MTSAPIDYMQDPVASGLPFAPASMTLLDLLSQDDAVVEQVAALLSLDGDSVAEVLRLANSPAFGDEQQIRNLAHAIVVLGTRRVKALIATVGMKQASRAQCGVQACWRHSVASAFLAADLASSWDLPAEEAYTAGLLHESYRPPVENTRSQPFLMSEVVDIACQLSSALGFPAGESEAAVWDLAPLLLRVPESSKVRCDPDRVARMLEEKIAYINN